MSVVTDAAIPPDLTRVRSINNNIHFSTQLSIRKVFAVKIFTILRFLIEILELSSTYADIFLAHTSEFWLPGEYQGCDTSAVEIQSFIQDILHWVIK